MGIDGTRRLWSTTLTLALACLGPPGHAVRAADEPPPRTGDPLCSVRFDACTTGPIVAVFTAFPGETAPFLDQADLTETFTIEGRRFDVGTIGGTRIVLVRTGIGKMNAGTAATIVVERFRPTAMVFSGVAGSFLNIGDVAVPVTWVERPSGDTFPSDPGLLAIAEQVAAAPPAFTQCALVPPRPPNQMLCLPQPLKLVVGGTGQTADPYGTNPFPCTPGNDPVFGCDPEPLASLADVPLAAEDMETASVARVAHANGIPFIGFRGVSDGASDPLGLPGFPAQFFTYYQIAADNAAAATIAFLSRRSAGDAARGNASPRGAGTGGATTEVTAACDWSASLSDRCAADTPSARLTDTVADVCGLLAQIPDAKNAAKAKKLQRRVRMQWRRTARLAKSRRQGLSPLCRRDVADALRERAKAK